MTYSADMRKMCMKQIRILTGFLPYVCGICNCSLCRQTKGWPATGTLYTKVNLDILVSCYILCFHSTYPCSNPSCNSIFLPTLSQISSLGYKSIAHYFIQSRSANEDSDRDVVRSKNPVSSKRSLPFAGIKVAQSF